MSSLGVLFESSFTILYLLLVFSLFFQTFKSLILILYITFPHAHFRSKRLWNNNKALLIFKHQEQLLLSKVICLIVTEYLSLVIWSMIPGFPSGRYQWFTMIEVKKLADILCKIYKPLTICYWCANCQSHPNELILSPVWRRTLNLYKYTNLCTYFYRFGYKTNWGSLCNFWNSILRFWLCVLSIVIPQFNSFRGCAHTHIHHTLCTVINDQHTFYWTICLFCNDQQ